MPARQPSGGVCQQNSRQVGYGLIAARHQDGRSVGELVQHLTLTDKLEIHEFCLVHGDKREKLSANACFVTTYQLRRTC